MNLLLLKKEKRDQNHYFLVLNKDIDSKVEILCDSEKNIISLGVENDIMVSPDDVEKEILQKYQKFCLK